VRFDAAGGLGAGSGTDTGTGTGTGLDLPAEPSDGMVKEYTVGEANRALELAYAMTVHKAQGSEWPVVVLSMFNHHFPMLSRGLLYTAVSRARKLLIVVGTRASGHIAVSQDRDQHRCTGLVERIRGACRQIDALLADPESGVSRALARDGERRAGVSRSESLRGPSTADLRSSSQLSHHTDQAQQEVWEGLGVGAVAGAQSEPSLDLAAARPQSETDPAAAVARPRQSVRLPSDQLEELWTTLELEEQLSTSGFGQRA
jgi:hypothetical protein